jgi:hypothetical protein
LSVGVVKSVFFGVRSKAWAETASPSPDAAVTVQPVHTRVPGRARLKIPALYRSRQTRLRLEAGLPAAEGIATARGNELTGSLLITFDRRRSVEDVVRLVAGLLEKPARPLTETRKEYPLHDSKRNAALVEPLFLLASPIHFSVLPGTLVGSSRWLSLPISFLRAFLRGMLNASPILVPFLVLILYLGFLVGREEGWSLSDTVYFTLATASTVGYGDLCPTKKSSKMIAVAITMLGLLLTGMVTALGVHSARITFAS